MPGPMTSSGRKTPPSPAPDRGALISTHSIAREKLEQSLPMPTERPLAGRWTALMSKTRFWTYGVRDFVTGESV